MASSLASTMLMITLLVNSLMLISCARVRIGQTVRSREIFDVQYRVRDGKTYAPLLVMSTTVYIPNNTPSVVTQEFSLNYTDYDSKTWNSTTSGSGSGSSNTRVKARVPYLDSPSITGGGSILIGDDEGEYNWGEDLVVRDQKMVKIPVILLPRSAILMRINAGIHRFDVPFSYNQRLTYVDGTESVGPTMNDGLFIGSSTHLHINVEVLPLLSLEASSAKA